MSAQFRPRLEVKLILNGEYHEFQTNLRDSLRLTNPKGNQEDMMRLTHHAAERLEIFKGDFDAFVDAVEDIDIREPAPLAKPVRQEKSSRSSRTKPE